jgi:hypothetical protein
MPRRSMRGLTVLASLAASCGGSPALGPPGSGTDAAAGSGGVESKQVTVSKAVLIESDSVPGEDVRLELEIVNTGHTPIENVTVLNAHVDWSGLAFTVSLTPDPLPPVPPITPGETRTLAFAGQLQSLGLCTPALRAQPEPHLGVVTMGWQLLTTKAGTVYAGVGVALTCASTPPPPPPLACPQSVDEACAAPDAPEMFTVHCSRTWMEALTDSYYCDMTLRQQQADCDGYEARFVDAVDTYYAYYYDASSGALSAITLTGGLIATCVAGPSSGFIVPTCADARPLVPVCP